MSLLLTGAIAATWLVLAVCFCAIGLLFINSFSRIEPSWYAAYLGIWIGFSLTMAGLMLWHFFLPVNILALSSYLLVSAVALFLKRRWFAALLSQRASRLVVVASCALTLWVANHALARGGMDDYNYEFQAVRWFHDYRIVPGLANLHGRLGFNNSHHLYAALLSTGPWQAKVNHIVNGLFVVLVLIFLVNELRRLIQGPKGSLELLLFPTLLLCPCLGLVLFGIFGPMISTLKSDVFVSAATMLLGCLFLKFAASRPGSDEYKLTAATTFLLACTTITVKISAAVFCGLIIVMVFTRCVLEWKRGVGGQRFLAASMVLGVFLVICLPVRGIILSGYPMYPSSALAASVDWRVPAEEARYERAYITSWAQLRPTYDAAAVTGWAWVPNWARSTVLTDKFNIVLPLLLTLVWLPLLIWRQHGKTGAPGAPPGWAYAGVLCACGAAVLVWFVEAPAGRFAIAYFWLMFANTVCWFVHRQSRGTVLGAGACLAIVVPVAGIVLFKYLQIPREFRAGMLMLLAFVVFLVIAFNLQKSWNHRLIAVLCVLLGVFQIFDRTLAHMMFRRYRELASLAWLDIKQWPEKSSASHWTPRMTDSGLIVYETRSPHYETPLPNTKYFNAHLKLRRAGDLSGGFETTKCLDGERAGYSVEMVQAADPSDREIVTPEQCTVDNRAKPVGGSPR